MAGNTELAGTFMDPVAYPPQPAAPPQMASSMPQAPAPPVQAPSVEVSLGQPRVQTQEDTDAAILASLQLGYPVTQEDVALLSESGKQRANQLLLEKEINAPVRVPGSPGQAEATIPTTSSEAFEGPANLPEIREAMGGAYEARRDATQAQLELERKRLQDQFLAAKQRRQQMEEQVQEREAELAYVERARNGAFQRAKGLQDSVRAKQIDPQRIFRNNPFTAVAAVLADGLMAMGGAGARADTVRSIVENDVALQLEEIQKMGMDADNALAMVAREYDGDLEQATAALKMAQSSALENEAAAQAAAMGLQQFPATVSAALADLAAYNAEQELQLGQAAKSKASQAFRYQPYVPATPGYDRAPTQEEVNERLEGKAKQKDLESRLETGRTRKEIAEAEESMAAKAADRSSAAQQMATEDRRKLGEELAKIVSSDLAAQQWAESTGGQRSPKSGQFEWGGEDMPGYWRGAVGGLVSRATGQQKIFKPNVAQAETNAIDAFARLRTGAVVSESEIPQFRHILLGPQGSEQQVQYGINLMAREGAEKRKLLEAAYGKEAVDALYGEILRQRQSAPEPPTVEPRD